MEVQKIRVRLDDELKSSGIFKIFQDISAFHCAKYGLSMHNLAEKNLMWVVVRQYVHIERYPNVGETLEISTWPGTARHMMFPRFYVVRDEKGEVIIKGSAMWTIVDRQSRTMVSPQNYGLELEGLQTGDECRLPSGIKKHELKNESSFVVPEEYIDSNRHMNNTRYYDAVENCLGSELAGKKLKEAMTEYVSEAVLGEEVKLNWDKADGHIFATGENNGIVFKMDLLYE